MPKSTLVVPYAGMPDEHAIRHLEVRHDFAAEAGVKLSRAFEIRPGYLLSGRRAWNSYHARLHELGDAGHSHG